MSSSKAAPICRLWSVLAALDLALALALPEGILRSNGLPVSARLGLIAWDLLLLAPWAAVALAPGLLTHALAERRRSAAWRRIALALRWLGVVAALSFFAWSWAAFWSVGHFLGFVGLRFLADSGWQVVEHALEMRPMGFLTLNLLLAIIAGTYLWMLQRDERRRASGPHGEPADDPQAISLRPAVLVGLLLGAVAWAGPRLALRGDPPPVDGHTLAVARTELAGPASRLTDDLNQLTAGPSPAAQAIRDLPIRRRSIVPLDDWLAAVDRDNVRSHNVLLVLVESLRPDELMAFGGRREVMPNLETLARDAVLYPKTWSQSSHSNYSDLCTMTSQYPLRDRTLYLYDSDSMWPRELIYDLLAPLGWRTAIFSSQNENWGRMLEWLDTDSLDELFHSEVFEGETYFPPGDHNFVEFAQARKRAGKVDDQHTVSAAIDWLRRDRERPFFLYLNLQNSHVPYMRPPGFPPRYGPESVDFEVSYGRFPRDKVDVVKDLYSDSLAYVDHQLGRLLDALRHDGRLDDTVVVITGDTGQAFYEHGFASHGSYLYEEVVRVPLIIRSPGLAPGVDSRIVQHVDLPPTVLELLGLPPHPSHQGRSLAASPDGTDSRPVYLVCQTPLVTQYAIVRSGWKLMLDVKRQSIELYHLDADPGETENLAEQRAEIHRQLLDQLLGWVFAQIEYHESPEWYLKEYPPILDWPVDWRTANEPAG